jgi:glycosyltransferase involved in cell wall biosynthesis
MMRISAVMAAYNAESHVSAAIGSMLAQRLPPHEIIVVDDGSTDRTLDSLRACGDGVRVIAMPHRGASAAFMTAVDAACGDVLAFNDADDLWDPQKLQVQAELLDQDAATDAVFGAVRQFVGPDPLSEAADLRPAQAGLSKIGMLVRRSAFLKFGAFDVTLQFHEFADWYARASQLGLRSKRHDDVVAYRRLHDGNTGRIERAKTRAEQLLIIKKALDRRRARESDDALRQFDRPDQQPQLPDIPGQAE